jgi:hypothetical protein
VLLTADPSADTYEDRGRPCAAAARSGTRVAARLTAQAKASPSWASRIAPAFPGRELLRHFGMHAARPPRQHRRPSSSCSSIRLDNRHPDANELGSHYAANARHSLAAARASCLRSPGPPVDVSPALAFRWLWRLIRFIARHPVADIFVALLVMAWRWLGWPGARSPSGAVRRAGGCGGGCRGRPRPRFRTR